jgi:hypothetical protein
MVENWGRIQEVVAERLNSKERLRALQAPDPLEVLMTVSVIE